MENQTSQGNTKLKDQSKKYGGEIGRGMNAHQRILVVDNDQDMSKFLDHMLEQEGYDTVVMTDANAVPDMLDNVAPDLVVLELPDGEDYEILDLIRKHSGVPIIVLSTDIKAESLQRTLSHGADDFVRIPFGIKPFMARVNAKLRRSRENIPVEI
jgi:DNA-binding response OmpR family regulator